MHFSSYYDIGNDFSKGLNRVYRSNNYLQQFRLSKAPDKLENAKNKLKNGEGRTYPDSNKVTAGVNGNQLLRNTKIMSLIFRIVKRKKERDQ